MSADPKTLDYFGREIDYLEDLGAKLRNLQGFTTLAHEVLQNADDVPGVTTFTFNICDDALIVENNGTFSDCNHVELPECPWKEAPNNGSHRCDFHRFRLVAGADKRNESGTTGAFGIGFISVYQITDRPELISKRHWILDESQPSSKRIAQCPGCDACRAPNPGTRFNLPWASNPNSTLRTKLRAEPTTPETPTNLLAELERSLPTAMLFLKKLVKVEIKQNGRLIRKLERVKQGDSVLMTDGIPANESVWHLIRGDYSSTANELRRLYPKLIEQKRSADVIIAIPATSLESGLLCATLPTQQRTGLPFHINADFYPSEDRKRIILEQDFQSEWNRAALQSAATIFSGALTKLPNLLGHRRLWSLLARLRDVAADATAGTGEKLYGQFWTELAPSIPNAPIVFSNQNKWCKPTEVYYLQQETERPALPVLESIGLNFVHEDLRSYQNLFTTAPISIRTLAASHVAEALKRVGLTQNFAKNNWPAFLQEPAALRCLWEELQILVNRRRSILQPHQHSSHQTTTASLSILALAVSRDGALCPCNTVYRAVTPGTEQIFSRLDPTIRFVTPETNSFPLFNSLCPEFGPAEAIAVLQKLGADTFATAVSSGVISLSGLFAWLVDQRTEILKTPTVKASLVSVPIYPSGRSFQSLNGLSLPGNFSDPLQLAALLDVNALPNHHDFLRELGIQLLSFPVYVTHHLTPALARADLSTEKRRAAALLIASRRSEMSDNDATRKVLATLPLVECSDGQFHAAAEVYFPGQIVSEVLSDTVLQAKLPAGHETIFTEMFKWLGVAEHPRFEDVVARIKALVSTPPVAVSLASIRVIFGHIAKRLQNDEPTSVLNSLRSLAWLPARKQSVRWCQPTEIYADFSFYLFDSQADFLNIERTTQNGAIAFLTFLGVKSSPSVGQVVAHLLHCAQAKMPVNQGVYAFLNNNADDPGILQLRSNPCLLLNDGRYYHPGEAFWTDHPFDRFRIQLGPELRKYNDLFQKLGVSETPNHRDARKILSELTEEFGSRNRALDDAAHAVTLACWRMLESALETKAIAPNDLASLNEIKCVPNAAHNLTPPSWMFFEDRAGLAAKFAGFLATNAIPRPLGASKAMTAAGVRTLATAVEVLLLECRNAVEDKTLTQRIQERRHQLARVLDARAAHADPTEKLTQLDCVRFECAELVSVSYQLKAFGQTLVSAPENCPALFRTSENLLLFVSTGGRVPWPTIARELALALYPDEEPGRIAPGLKEVLSAETTEAAKAVLDELGFSTLESPPTAPVTGTKTIGELGGQTTPADSPPPTEPPPLTPGQAANVTLGLVAAPPNPPPPGLEKPNLPEGQPTGGSGATGGPGGKSGQSASGPRPPAPRRGKLRSYVVKDPTPLDGETDPAKARQRGVIASAGVAKVMEYETDAKRKPTEMPAQHRGYDIESQNGSGEIERFIEVKSISGYWGTEGVGITSPQFFKAVELGDQYWLYVVERADQPDARIFCIQNPALKVDQFLYDDGWQNAAPEASSTNEMNT